MSVRFRLLPSIVVGLTLVSLTGCALQASPPAGNRANDTRMQAGKGAASGVVAAAARRAASDFESYFSGDVSSDNGFEAVPSTFGPDPLLYSVRFASDPYRSDNVTAAVRMSSSADPRIIEVGLRWDPTARRSVWRKGRYVEVPGDWVVVGLQAVAGD